MFLHLANRSKYENLHLSTALEDWDMLDELKQCITIDQYFAGAEEKTEQCTEKCPQKLGVTPCMSNELSPQKLSIKPSLWLVVDPNLVIPCQYVPALASEPCISNPSTPEIPAQSPADYFTTEDSEEEHLTSASEQELLPFSRDPNKIVHSYNKPSLWLVVDPVIPCQCHGRKAHLRRTLSQYDNWPRPPINYCNLISLALRNSEDGSLNVQQIYSFVREHFPFFRAAPDGWKNTVRHNLCFSSSFEKISGWVCSDGHRRSCLWKLTCQGHKKFCTEMHALSDDLLHILRRSMNKPALMELMFGM
uniref:Fork-head domain-containing protein n=1 Tax=Pyxicephalus adspersus TaxID=30357 RepID=A0AAV2ZGP6_PYXAD|nr:TPA: hypothetical protein GDO54_003576 [Pyxicephalus adspersus]